MGTQLVGLGLSNYIFWATPFVVLWNVLKGRFWQERPNL